jgi:pimeloyl-ACP methyl ester carboxylesterase
VSEVPRTKFAADGDSYIAYQVLGDGEHDVLYVPTAVHAIDLMWDDPVRARGLRRLATTNRVMACDLMGVGSSDPVLFNDMPAMQTWGDGLRVVLDAAGSEQATIFAMAEAGLPVMLFAASHPDRVRSLILWAGYARFARADDYPHGMPDAALRKYLESYWEIVGTGDLVDRWAPSRADETWFRELWGKSERLSGGRRYMAQIVDVFLHTDVRGVLEAIQAPVLVLRREDDPHVRHGHAQFLVDHIPDARLVELPGYDHEWFSGNVDDALDAIEQFLTGRRTAIATNRVLATVLFTDIVGSTERAAALGDAEWARVLDAHD